LIKHFAVGKRECPQTIHLINHAAIIRNGHFFDFFAQTNNI
jgi:hypothetical protein